VRDFSRLLFCLSCAIPWIALPASPLGARQNAGQNAPAAPSQPTQAPPPVPPSAPAQAPPAQLAPSIPSGPVVVIDPAHGGTDSGARGPNGVFEKNVVLDYARTLRSEFERQGMRAILTRNDDSNPSYDDRAGAANAYRDAIFISLHVSSTGTSNTARCYFDLLTVASAGAAGTSPSTGSALVSWDEAQLGHLAASKRLAALIQLQLVQSFSGSPVQPIEAPVRQLRSIEGPAVAVEVSSVAASSTDALTAQARPLVSAVVRSVVAFRASGSN
jgi:N-acetylmuramoyl-L-alanine amidase